MAGQAVSWQASDLHSLADLLSGLAPGELPSDHLDQLEAVQRIKAAAAAAQVAITATFADAADSEHVPTTRRRTPPRAMSIGAEVALATLASPHAGEQRVLLSRRLRDDLPHTLAALARGDLTEDRAFAVAREVAHLDPSQRREIDDDIAPRLPGLGDLRLRQTVRRACLTIAAEAETKRHRRARADRRVTSRALDDGTGQLTATLPLEDLATVRAALDAAAATARADGDPRTAGQVRADTLAARITGLDPAADIAAVRVNLVIGVESLLGDGTEPGLIPGLGFLPAALCTDLVRRASTAAKATLRRLFASPHERALVAMESTSRRFTASSPSSSPSVTPAPAAHRVAMRRSGTTTTCSPQRTAAPPQRPSARASANAATTSRRPPAGPAPRRPARRATRGPRRHRAPADPQVDGPTLAGRPGRWDRLLALRAPAREHLHPGVVVPRAARVPGCEFPE